MYNAILVPLDGSKRAERILPHVEALAQKFGARLHLLQVIEPMVVGVSPYDAGALFVAEEIDRRTQEAKAYLAGLEGELTAKKIQAQSQVEYGPVVSTILEMADQHNVDLIAMASHGRTGLARVFYGSVAAGILNRAERPLLVIRAQE
ncbi:MAG: universal stress protein [Caldilineaceae bacterium]|nr:universal stress protein [Caldilineaceae bacterium]